MTRPLPRWNSKYTVAALATSTVVLGAAACYAFRTVGAGSLGTGPADVLIVFGTPADMSGGLTPMQRWRVEEGVAEYRRGRARYLLFAGGAAANQYVESQVMARYAVALGVPSSAVLREEHSTTTIENIRDVTPMLKGRGWTRAELISSADHLPRIAVLMANTPFQWRLHAAETPGRNHASQAVSYAEEASATLLLRSFGPAAETIIHAIAVCVHWIVFIPRYVLYRLRSVKLPA